ncbi:MAG TPA: hypothetical protein ENN51_00950 [candidate division WOR-3 bacterium]|uniref:Uncharacterized protein n=1 Tax=candidate division WOR-3 bacterium TaxID=2052148 RepID=A0A7V0XEA9_UNCW3|nr:hypothetical protein [candidate division WOR-3 bacterium]
MPPRLRLDVERSIEISYARLSERIGCGLMLASLPKYDSSDALNAIMENYGCDKVFADKAARKILENNALLRTFHENAFIQKLPIRRNFYDVYSQRDIWLAYDPRQKLAWFLGNGENRVALGNYHRDALLLGLKPHGVLLTGSTVRLSAIGWQNLCDLISDKFLDAHREIERVEVMGLVAGVRWRPPVLGIGSSFLNFQDQERIKAAAEAALRGENGGVVEG